MALTPREGEGPVPPCSSYKLLRLAALQTMSTGDFEVLDFRSAALRFVEHLQDLGRLIRDGVRDVAQHFQTFLNGRMFGLAVPAGRRDRLDVTQHRLIAARAAKFVPLAAMAVVGRIIDSLEMH